MDENLVLPVLPTDVLDEHILARVPIESLMRYKGVCKHILNRVSEMDYIYKHLDLSQERFVRLDQMVRFINPEANDVNSTAIPDCLGHGNFVSSVVHCDGLLLCRNRQISKLIIWNPYKMQFRFINGMDFFSPLDRYGFGYHKNTRSEYKLLRMYDGEREKEEGLPNKYYEVQIDIYETRTRSWRRIYGNLDWQVEGDCAGLSVKGNMYWLAEWKAEVISAERFFIQCFDFSNETFSPICALPLGFHYHTSHTNSLSVYKRDALSLLHQDLATTDMEIWVTNPLTHELVSWSHHFTVSSSPDLPPLRTHHYIAYPVHFVNKDEKLVVLCREIVGDEDSDSEEENAKLRMYVIDKEGIVHRTDLMQGIFLEHMRCGYVYTPSQVPVPNLLQ